MILGIAAMRARDPSLCLENGYAREDAEVCKAQLHQYLIPPNLALLPPGFTLKM